LLVVAEAAVVQQAPAPIMLYVYIGLYRPQALRLLCNLKKRRERRRKNSKLKIGAEQLFPAGLYSYSLFVVIVIHWEKKNEKETYTMCLRNGNNAAFLHENTAYNRKRGDWWKIKCLLSFCLYPIIFVLFSNKIVCYFISILNDA